MRRLLAGLVVLAACGDAVAVTEETSSGGVEETSSGAVPTTGGSTGVASTGAAESTGATSTGGASETSSGESTDGSSSGDESSSGETGPVCDEPAACDECTCTDVGWSCDCPPLLPEAGFIEIEPVEYVVGVGNKAQARTSWPTRMFYSFRPADDANAGGPLFLFFNGGPGTSTGILMAFGTGPYDLRDGTAQPNPGSWTALGDLLYVDARGTGFSYNLVDDPSVQDTRLAAFDLTNFNTYLDAADFLRVLMRFMTAHPQLLRRDVVIVGESYGGVRAAILHNLLLFFAAYDEGGEAMYRDPALVAEIEAFLAARDPDVADWTPAAVAEGFGRQVLIQPGLGDLQRSIAGTLLEQPGSPVHQLAAELGLDYMTCAEKGGNCEPWQNAVLFIESSALRSRYDLDASSAWLANIFALKKARLSDLSLLETSLGVVPAEIPLLLPAAREDAFRMGGVGSYPADGGTIVAGLGDLAAWDRYYLPFLAEANNAFRSGLATFTGVAAGDPHFAELFLHNLVYVDTFITAAERDVAVYAPAIPVALASYDAIAADVTAQGEEMVVTYTADPFPGEAPPGTRSVRFPVYDAGHSVGYDLPVVLRDDVAAWLAE